MADYILQEDGASRFTLEDSSGFLLLEDQTVQPPFLTIGATGFSPAVTTTFVTPFLTIDFDPKPVTLYAGALPPVLPPSLPPTIPPGTSTGPGIPLPPLSSGGLAGIRFYQGPPWRWVVTDLDGAILTFLDRLAYAAEVRYVLDKPFQARLTVPSDNPEVNITADTGATAWDEAPFVNEGDRLLYGFRREGTLADDPYDPKWVCRYAGVPLQLEDAGGTENARTTISAWDPWQLLYERPMVNIAGEFPTTAGFFSFDDSMTGTIALTFLRNTILNHGTVRIDAGPDWGGTTMWGGTIETTTQMDLAFEQGLTVGEVWDQLIGTGTLDIVLTPIWDPHNRPGYLAELSIYALAGQTRNDAIFAWDKPGRNLRGINRLYDGTKRANVVKYHFGQGGPSVPEEIDALSISRYGEYWAQQFFPGRSRAAAIALAELQVLLRANGVQTVAVEPSQERAPFLFTEYYLGDFVPEYASDRLRAELAGYQRIYGFVVTVDENSYEQVPQLLGSPE